MTSESDKKITKAMFYEMASRADQVNKKAKRRFQEPPFYMHFLESWTTKREEDSQ